MITRKRLFKSSLINKIILAAKITSLTDLVEKSIYCLAALIALGFLWFLIYFMGIKVFTFFLVFFGFLVMAKGMFVLFIK